MCFVSIFLPYSYVLQDIEHSTKYFNEIQTKIAATKEPESNKKHTHYNTQKKWVILAHVMDFHWRERGRRAHNEPFLNLSTWVDRSCEFILIDSNYEQNFWLDWNNTTERKFNVIFIQLRENQTIRLECNRVHICSTLCSQWTSRISRKCFTLSWNRAQSFIDASHSY